MNDLVIITAYVVTDDIMNSLGHRSHILAQISDAEVITIAAVAARYFGNNHERALCVMKGMHYVSGKLSVSRFNRRLHQLKEWFALLLETLGELFAVGEAFIIDSMPVPVCKRARGQAQQKSPEAPILWLLRGQKREVLWLAPPPDLHARRLTSAL